MTVYVPTKRCASCYNHIPTTGFYPKKRRCKECCKARMKEIRAAQTPEERERLRVWRRNYKTKLRRAQGMRTREQIAQQSRNRKKEAALRLAEKRAAAKTERALKPKLSPTERFRVRYRTDPEFRTKQLMRNYLRKNAKKYAHLSGRLAEYAKAKNRRGIMWEILGYSSDELMAHLQKQFTKKMTVDHFMRGEIHIDHIVPQSQFDLNTMEGVRACHALTNLRPMWAKENIKKSSKLLFLL